MLDGLTRGARGDMDLDMARGDNGRASRAHHLAMPRMVQSPSNAEDTVMLNISIGSWNVVRCLGEEKG